MDFYGRDAEHAFLLDSFRSCVTSGSPRLVTVVAETGVGKSRLVQHLYNTITKDEQFDPGASNYWPDAFQTPVMQLRVTPDMHTHTPAGPPRFWWLGVRWSNPQERNVLQSSVLPELQKQLTLHAAITKSFATKWQQSLENIVATMREDDIRRDIAIETLTLLLQVNIPLSGLIIDIIRPAIDPWTGADIVYADEHEDAAHEELRTQLLQTFTSMYAKPNRIPIVLWLDDAQWMDPGSREFFRQLYTQAVARKWPLFFVATHWPQEWEEYGKTTFLGRGHRLTLGEPAQSDMAALVRSRLPGLTTMQQELILAKSMGNYLALLENIGQLLSSLTNFQESDVTGALSAHGEQEVTAWETNRQRRIKQRFEAFESDVRALLARFSHIGSTFVRSVVRTYATGQGIPYSEALVNRCIAPLTIVSEVSAEFHEFRDRGYFSVAEQYFADWLHEDEHVGLTNAIRTEVERFVDSGYTAEAEFAADAQTLLAQLSDQEQTLILNLALKTAPNHRQLWIRTVLLRCKILAAQRQWEQSNQPRFQAFLDQDLPGLTEPSAWTVWVPKEAKGSAGTKLAPQPDGSFLAAKGAVPDQEQFEFMSEAPQRPLTGLRLEALVDPSLPQTGPGRAGNGNFQLSRVRVEIESAEGVRREVALSKAVADFEQNSEALAVASALTGKKGGGCGRYDRGEFFHRRGHRRHLHRRCAGGSRERPLLDREDTFHPGRSLACLHRRHTAGAREGGRCANGGEPCVPRHDGGHQRNPRERGREIGAAH